MRPRSVGYALVVTVIAVAFTFAIVNRAPLDFDIIRDRGTLYAELSDGSIQNEYQIKIMNKSHRDNDYIVDVVSPAWISINSARMLSVRSGDLDDFPLTLMASQPTSTIANVAVRLCTAGESECVTEHTKFISSTPTNNTPNTTHAREIQ